MEKGATNSGDTQHHAYYLHGVGTPFENPTRLDHGNDLLYRNSNPATGNAVPGHGHHPIHSLGTYDHTGPAVLDSGYVYSTDNINVGSDPFNAIAAHGVGYYDHGLSLGINNIEAGPQPYSNAATPGLNNDAFQETILTPTANSDLNGGIGRLSDYNHNGASCLGRSLGNVGTSGIAYDQRLSAALSLQHGNGVYPTGYASATSYLPNNGITIRMAHGSSDYATTVTALGAQSIDTTFALGSSIPLAPTTGFAGDHYLQPRSSVSHINYIPSSTTPSNTFGTVHGSNSSCTTNNSSHPISTTPATSSTLSPSASDTVTGPNSRPCWPCTTYAKTFSRQNDMVRHAKKHTGERQYLCPAAGCKYKGSYRQDKLEQHRRNCGH